MKEVLLQEAMGSHPDGHEKMLVTIFYATRIPLSRLGVENFYLTVLFSVD
jgi:hypothetical protein